MKFFSRYQEDGEHQENIFWASMSDLMLGLLIVFIILFCFAMMGFTKQSVETKSLKAELSEKIEKQLNKQNISADIDKYSGIIKISDLELFEVNSATISPKGKAYLNKVIPVYLNTLLSDQDVRKNISQIIIEGHTDSLSYRSSRSKYDDYMKNLNLSLKRAYALTDYVIRLEYPQKNAYKQDLIKLISTNGKSFSKPILNEDGKEDHQKSRRVELKFQIKEHSFIDLIKNQKIDKK